MRTGSSLVGQLTSYHLITCLTVCWEGELSFFWETAFFLQLEGRFEAGTAQHSVVYSNTMQWDHNTANWLGLVVFTKTGFHWIAVTFSSFTSTSVGRIGLDRGFMSKIQAFNTFYLVSFPFGSYKILFFSSIHLYLWRTNCYIIWRAWHSVAAKNIHTPPLEGFNSPPPPPTHLLF